MCFVAASGNVNELPGKNVTNRGSDMPTAMEYLERDNTDLWPKIRALRARKMLPEDIGDELGVPAIVIFGEISRMDEAARQQRAQEAAQEAAREPRKGVTRIPKVRTDKRAVERLWESGLSMRAVGRKLGISHVRVHKILEQNQASGTRRKLVSAARNFHRLTDEQIRLLAAALKDYRP